MYTQSAIITEIEPISAYEFIKREIHEKSIIVNYITGAEKYDTLKGDVDIAMPFNEDSKEFLLISIYSATDRFTFKATTAPGNYAATESIVVSDKANKKVLILIPVPVIPPGIGVQIKTFGNETGLFVNPYSPNYPAKPL